MGGGRDDPFEPTGLGDERSAGTAPLYVLGGADLVVVDEDALALSLDFEVLVGVMRELALTDPRRHEILRALERSLDVYDLAADTVAARAGAGAT